MKINKLSIDKGKTLKNNKKGWKRKNLVEALGKSDAWLSKIMDKKRGLSIQTLFDIARALEIDPVSLLPEIKNPKLKISFEEYIREIVQEEIEKALKNK